MSNDSSVLVTGNPAALSRLAMLEASRAASSVSTRGAQHFFGGPSRRSARWAQPCPHRTTPGRLAGPGLQPQRCLRGRAAPHFRNKIINAGAVIAFEKGGSWPRQTDPGPARAGVAVAAGHHHPHPRRRIHTGGRPGRPPVPSPTVEAPLITRSEVVPAQRIGGRSRYCGDLPER